MDRNQQPGTKKRKKPHKTPKPTKKKPTYHLYKEVNKKKSWCGNFRGITRVYMQMQKKAECTAP